MHQMTDFMHRLGLGRNKESDIILVRKMSHCRSRLFRLRNFNVGQPFDMTIDIQGESTVWNIGICDSNTAALGKSETTNRQYLERQQIKNTIRCFEKGEEVLQTLREDHNVLDALFIEVELEKENGIEVVRQIQNEGFRIPIVFLVENVKYCSDVFAVDCCYFVLKKKLTNYLPDIIKRAMECDEKQKQGILILSSKQKRVLLMAEDIFYCERTRRVTTIVFKGGEIRTSKTLKEIQERLNRNTKALFQSHNSFLVNFEQVKELRTNEFLMSNDVIIPISRTYKKQIRQDFSSWYEMNKRDDIAI